MCTCFCVYAHYSGFVHEVPKNCGIYCSLHGFQKDFVQDLLLLYYSFHCFLAAVCDLETDSCGWYESNPAKDNFDWLRATAQDTSATPGVAPRKDHTSGSLTGMYREIGNYLIGFMSLIIWSDISLMVRI